jgi:hypothetical protein
MHAILARVLAYSCSQPRFLSNLDKAATGNSTPSPQQVDRHYWSLLALRDTPMVQRNGSFREQRTL